MNDTYGMSPEKVEKIVSKWSRILDHSTETLSPIKDPHIYRCTAMLLENQKQWMDSKGIRLLSETTVAGSPGSVFGAGGNMGGTVGNTDFYASGDSRLPKILIPMIRRTFPELITNEIVGVQPMSGPVGMAFALRYIYEGSSLDWQDPTRRTYDATNPSKFRGGPQSTADGRELGYNELYTHYTGTSSAALSGLDGDTEGSSEFYIPPEDRGVAEWLSNYEMTGEIPQVTFDIFKTTVEAGTRRIASRWSVELEQDMKSMHGIDIDNEMTNTLSYEIQAEIDREMVIRMKQAAVNGGYEKGWSTWTPISADGRWLGERNRDFYQKVVIEANRISVRNRRGVANFIITTPTVCAIFESLPEFQYMPVNSTVTTQQTGIAKVGTLAGRFTIYRDSRTESQQTWVRTGVRTKRHEYCLLGYKGPEFYDTGIVYCPYIPIMIQRTIGPNDFSPRVGLMTRYGVVDNIFGANLYYHVIVLKDIGESFVPGSAHKYL